MLGALVVELGAAYLEFYDITARNMEEDVHDRELIAELGKLPVAHMADHEPVVPEDWWLQPDQEETDELAAQVPASTRLAEPTDDPPLRESVDAALDELSESEAAVIRLRFGLDDDKPRKLEEVSRELNLTREGVRKIEVNALSKLRRRVSVGYN